MPGPRDHDWAHVHVEGDPDAAAPYLPFARKLLGFVKQEAGRNGLLTYRMARQLEDGAVVVAEIRGGIPRMTIAPAPRGASRPPMDVVGDFVVWPRTLAYPDGVDTGEDAMPQFLLRQDREQRWTVYAADRTLPGNATASYGGRFLNGLRRAGNVDWVGPDGERVSWYGPASRAWLDAHVQPRRQYGRFVFMLGEPLLDIEQYALDTPEHATPHVYVLGAALKRIDAVWWLYTVQMDLPEIATDLTPIPDGAGRYTPPYPQMAAQAHFFRYRLRRETDAAGVDRFRVVAGSREALGWIGDLRAEPWAFDSACTEATCTTVVQAWAARVTHAVLPPGTWDEEDDTSAFPDVLPQAAQNRYRVGILADGSVALVGLDTLSLTPGGAGAAAATDYRAGKRETAAADTRVELKMRMDATFGIHAELGALSLPLAVGREVDVGGVTHVETTRRWILHANLRDELLVVLRQDFLVPTGGTVLRNDESANRIDGVMLEVWHRARRIHEARFDRVGPRFQLRIDLPADIYGTTFSAGTPIAPGWLVSGATFVKMDTITPIGGGWQIWPHYMGCNITFAWLGYPSDHYFGTNDPPVSNPAPRPPTPIGNYSKVAFSGDRADFDGHYSVLGAAAAEQAVAVSCTVPSEDGNTSAHFITGGTLPALTGIGGAGERYHPIWLLGTPPGRLT